MYRLILTLVLFASGSGCITNEKIDDKSQDMLINKSILEIASLSPEVNSTISKNASYEITELSTEDIIILSKKYPVIYDNLPYKRLYRIDYKGEKGMLVIVDLEKKKVLRYFRTAGVSLG